MWLLALFLAAGCEDPSNVGLGIIGEGDREPSRLRLESAQLPSERAPRITGGIRTGTTYSGPERYLVGIADDPVFGPIEAKAYVDFATPTTAGSEFRNGTLTSVSLFFETDGYVYGDTTLVTRLVISEMAEAWTAFGVTADTTFTPGDTVISVPFVATENDLTVALPEDWVTRNRAVLLDENFTDVFDGFQISATEPSAVAGFLGLPAFMRVVTTTGSVDYPMSKIVTTLSKEPGPPVFGRTALQDGVGDNAVLSFDFDVDSIAASAVSRSVLNARIDMTAFDSAPLNFVRPVPAQANLVGIETGGVRRVLLSAPIGSDGRISFVSTTASAGEFTFVRSVQRAVTGNSQFGKYAISIAEAQAAIGSALLYNSEADEDSPTAVVTLVTTPFAP